ncbi:MAG: hypothetical protein GXP45_03900 [bacterium]|nr:hypothetical protein [bacterium]
MSNFDPEISKRNNLRNTILPQIFELAHKNTETENSFLKSMQNIYEELENTEIFNTDRAVSKLLFCKTVDIKMSPYRNAEWAYRLECFE